MLRSNPYCNGFSITGLLDHSICGEGLFTLMREYKPGIAEVVQDGFAPLKWCLLAEDTHVYAGRPFTFEAVLANEDALKAGTYTAQFRIFSAEHGIVFDERHTFDVTPEDLKGLAVSVYKKQLTLDIPAGTYTLLARLEAGGAATDGRLELFVSDPRTWRFTVPEMAGFGLPEQVTALLEEHGVAVRTPEELAADKCYVLAVGMPSDAEFGQIRILVQNGSRAAALTFESFGKDGDPAGRLPLAHRPEAPEEGIHSKDWLYHKEYLLKRGGRLF